MALSRLGRPQEALSAFDSALAIDPRIELALINKADALDALGRHAEALAEYDKALAVNARNVVTWCNRGTALEALGRDAEAAESFDRALALNPNLAEVRFNLANVLQRMERYEEAVPHYRRTVALRPNLALAFANLGRALSALARWQEALDSYARALQLGAASPQLHYAMAVAFAQLDRYEESLASLDKVLALDPEHAAALNKRGLLLLILGRVDAARESLERALLRDPRNTELFFGLSSVKRFKAGDAQIAAMEKLAGDSGVSVGDRVNLHFALGKAYRDAGSQEQSFRHFLQGNALKRGQIEYDEAATIGNLDRVAEIFTPALLQTMSGHGNPSSQPIFIVGMMRSGSTLIEQILGSHPQVYGAGERSDFKMALEKVAGTAECSTLVPALTPVQLEAIGTAYLAGLEPDARGALRFTDKMLANFTYVGLIRLALPNARIIHARRDPVDTCLSCFSTRFDFPLNATYDLAELGRYYRAYERLMAHWRKVLPEGAMLEVQYEDMVEDIETQARRIVDYCGLPWDDACLAFYELKRPVRTASAAQVRQPIYRSSVGAWEAYREELKPLLEALGQSAG